MSSVLLTCFFRIHRPLDICVLIMNVFFELVCWFFRDLMLQSLQLLKDCVATMRFYRADTNKISDIAAFNCGCVRHLHCRKKNTVATTTANNLGEIGATSCVWFAHSVFANLVASMLYKRERTNNGLMYDVRLTFLNNFGIVRGCDGDAKVTFNDLSSYF